MEEGKICKECGATVSGRSDKKFCSDECRTAYHNRVYLEKNSEIIRINKILKKNYLILKRAIEKDGGKTSVTLLLKSGFIFDYLSSFEQSENGNLLLCCYDIKYSISSTGEVGLTMK